MALTLRQKLDEAKLAVHNLNTGNAVRVSVDKDGSRVEFAVADLYRLQNYVKQLEAELSKPVCCNGTQPSNSGGPLGFYF